MVPERTIFKGSMRQLYRLFEDLFKEIVLFKEPFYESSLKNYLRKWFFQEPWFERFFVEPKMVP